MLHISLYQETQGLDELCVSGCAFSFFIPYFFRGGGSSAKNLGRLIANPNNPESISNPYGAGSPYRADSINNPYGGGSPYVADSPNNRTGKDSAKGNLDRREFS